MKASLSVFRSPRANWLVLGLQGPGEGHSVRRSDGPMASIE